MSVYLLTSRGVRKMNLSKQPATHTAIIKLEKYNADLNDARLNTIELLAELEERQRLNKPRAIMTLQKALHSYESLLSSLTTVTQSGYLRHFYKSVERAANNEINDVRAMFESILNGDNDKFNRHYKRYISLLSL